MQITFKTVVTQEENMNATGLPVPAEAVATLDSGKRPKVKVSLNDYTYRSTVAAYGEVFMLPLSKEHRDAAGVKAGDEVEVMLELDTEPRTVEVPDDLAMALEEGGVTAVFDALALSKRKEHVRQVTSAKAEETRQRRIAKIVTTLSAS
ncbi:MAG: YdeI/OmpD-associated family protein [Candidatus Promineifilaceae bacterium]